MTEKPHKHNVLGIFNHEGTLTYTMLFLPNIRGKVLGFYSFYYINGNKR